MLPVAVFLRPFIPLLQRWRGFLGRGPAWTDVAFGVVLPIALILVDRYLPMADPEGFLPLRPFATLLVVASAGVMLVAYRFRNRPGWAHAVLAGPLLLGAAAALAIAVRLAPAALIGLIVVIGVLGLVPWFTAAVFLRAGLRAYAAGRRKLARGPTLALMAVAASVVFGTCLTGGVIAMRAEAIATQTLIEDGPGADRAARRLRLLWLFPQVRLERLRRASQQFADWSAAGERLRERYHAITGRPPDPDDW